MGRSKHELSCLWLERPGAWRYAATVIILGMMTVPWWPLLGQAFSGEAQPGLDRPFVDALANSLFIALAAACAGLVIGWPLGALLALYEFRGRRFLLAAVALPLLVPTFLWAIGWNALATRAPGAMVELVTGRRGCVIVLTAQTTSLVLLTCYLGARSLTQSQVEAARLAGGEHTVMIHACRAVGAPAALSAALAGIISLSDPGAGQILGVRTVASEILVSFSALYDFAGAARQCLVLSLLVLVVAIPLAWLAAPRLASRVAAKQVRPAAPKSHATLSLITGAALTTSVFVLILMPVAGLVLPVTAQTDFARALSEVARTGINTVLYGLGAGCLSASLAFALAAAVGRNYRLSCIALGACLVFISFPPALGALGIVRLSTSAPAALDIFVRSRGTVAIGLSLRLAPIAVLIAIRACQATSPTWTLAAAVHGVRTWRYLRRVLIRILAPAFGLSVLLVSLLATADVSSVLLLHPPGEASLPLAIFTVMANAPESLVASLCLVYIALSLLVLAAGWSLARRLVP